MPGVTGFGTVLVLREAGTVECVCSGRFARVATGVHVDELSKPTPERADGLG